MCGSADQRHSRSSAEVAASGTIALQVNGLALEGPWLDCMSAGEPENAATVMRLMLAHMAALNKRVMSTMVLDRLDADLADVSSADLKARCQQGCQQASEH